MGAPIGVGDDDPPRPDESRDGSRWVIRLRAGSASPGDFSDHQEVHDD